MKIIKFIVSGCLIVLMSIILSCSEDLLEIDPYGPVSQSTLANEVGINKLLIGAYSLLDGGGASGGGMWTGWGLLRATDDGRIGSDWGVWPHDAFLYQITDGNIADKWKFLYAAVSRANSVLEILPKVKGSTPEKLLQIEAEAKFLRGVNYLYLAMTWKNVPWIDETVSYSEGNYLVTNTEDIYPKIEADFKFAADNLEETKSEVGRANKWAAKSFLAKTYMFQHKFTEAKALLVDIITNGITSNGKKYALLEQYNYNFITREKHGSEAVFTVQMSVNDGSSGGNGNPCDFPNGMYGPAPGWAWFGPSFDLANAYQVDSITGLPLLYTYQDSPIITDNGLNSSDPFTPHQGTLDPRLDWTMGRRGIPYRDWGIFRTDWIFQSVSGPYASIKSVPESARRETDIASNYENINSPYNMIRFADVLLWAAESEVEIGSLQEAENYVNMVRARAANPEGFPKTYINPDDPLLGFSDTPAANYKVGLYNGQFEANGKSYAREAVRFERRLELAMEHHRFFDMIRYDGIEFNVAERINWFMQYEESELIEQTMYSSGVFVKNKHEYFPIPLVEIENSLNEKGESVLVQNPGY